MGLHDLFKVKDVTVTVRREDKRYKYPLPPHGKMGVLSLLCGRAKANGYKMIGCFGSKYSNWIAGLPIVAYQHGIKPVVCYPANSMKNVPDWVRHIEDQPYNAELWLIRPNMVTINQSQAKSMVEEDRGCFIPFGFDDPEVVQYLSRRLELPNNIASLVISCGSGITLASVLRGIQHRRQSVQNIFAVSSGRSIDSIIKTVSKHTAIPKKSIKWVDNYDYADVPDIKCPWPAHSHFELKAYDWLYKNIRKLPEPIYFLNMGADSK